jgi:hypothetical protein
VNVEAAQVYSQKCASAVPLFAVRTVISTHAPEVSTTEGVPSNIAIMEKPTIFGEVNWSTTDARQSFLTYWELPLEAISAVGRQAQSVFQRFVYYGGGTITVRAILQSNLNMQGCVALGWAPLMTSDQAFTMYGQDLVSTSITRHAYLYAGGNKMVDFIIPYVHNVRFSDVRAPTSAPNIGTFFMQVYSPLKTGSGAVVSACKITLMIFFQSAEFSVINPTAVSVIPQMGAAQTKITNINLEHVVGSTIDANQLGDAFSTDQKADVSGAPMDKPNVAVNPSPVVVREFPTFTNAVNLDYAVNMDLAAAHLPLISPSLVGTTQDEMSMAYLTTKPCYTSYFQVMLTDIIGQAPFTADLCPCYEFFYAPLNSVVVPSLLSYVSLPYSFWQGDLEFELIAIATVSHSVRLAVCSHYGFEASGLDVDEAFGQYMTQWLVTGTQSLKIRFPWRSATDWKKVNNGSNIKTADYSMGQFSVRVVNSLTAPETVSNVVEVLVFMNGGPNYRLACLANNAQDFEPQRKDLSNTSVPNRVKAKYKQTARLPKTRPKRQGKQPVTVHISATGRAVSMSDNSTETFEEVKLPF